MNDAAVTVARGPRAAEELLLAELGRLAQEARQDPGLLARPVRVVVPSASLREHLLARCAAELGALAGVTVQTLRGLAYELVQAAGQPALGGDLLFPLLVRRAARREEALREALEPLEDGYGVVAASVSDLLDAGFEPALEEGLLEAAGEGAAHLAARARCLVRVAARVSRELAALGREHRSGLFRRADALLREGRAELVHRGLLVHGYADATGVQADLIQALVQYAGGRLLLDEPPDPAEPSRAAPGAAFLERLLLRLGEPAPAVVATEPDPPQLDLRVAPGAEAEVRGAADAIRALLDAGEVPERIGIVARDLTPYRLALRSQLPALGIPFSGGEGFLGAAGRRLHALLEVLERGPRCAADAWLDAAHRFGAERLADLRLGLHGMGVGRLADVAQLDVVARLGDQAGYRLAARRGLAASGPEGGAEPGGPDPENEPEVSEADARLPQGAHARRRVLSRDTLEKAEADASGLLQAWQDLRAGTHAESWVAGLRKLLRALHWQPETPGFADLQGALAAIAAEVPSDLALEPGDGLQLLRRALAGAGRTSLGGQGGGVQALSVTEARARTWQHLFVLGVNRDVFPRVVTEDPLLPDGLRGSLLALLPDLPVKARGVGEDRYLFAQTCASAPRVTLSWQGVSDEGKERTPSPLVVRLCQRRGLAPEPLAPVLAPGRAEPRPLHEHVVRAALDARRDALAEALGLVPGIGPEVASARIRALEEIDPVRPREDLGPYLGLVGAAVTDDPRLGDVFVTRLENVAWCPWQAFLQRALGIEPVPDALAELPDVSPLLIGNAVHEVLDAIGREAGALHEVELAEAAAARPSTVAWPGRERLDELLQEAAESVASDAGIVLPGFARMLALRAKPLLERFRELEWPHGVRDDVLGVELHGAVEVEVAGERLRLRFRADRVDALDKGMVLTDYKTGRPVSDAKKEVTRRKKLLTEVREGKRLQAPAYALGAPGTSGEGRYLFGRPGLPEEVARVRVSREDSELLAGFRETADTLLRAWRGGGLPPRLAQADKSDENPACDRCEVSEACLRGDSGSRRRLLAWSQAAAARPEPLRDVERRAFEALQIRGAK